MMGSQPPRAVKHKDSPHWKRLFATQKHVPCPIPALAAPLSYLIAVAPWKPSAPRGSPTPLLMTKQIQDMIVDYEILQAKCADLEYRNLELADMNIGLSVISGVKIPSCPNLSAQFTHWRLGVNSVCTLAFLLPERPVASLRFSQG